MNEAELQVAITFAHSVAALKLAMHESDNSKWFTEEQLEFMWSFHVPKVMDSSFVCTHQLILSLKELIGDLGILYEKLEDQRKKWYEGETLSP